MLSPFGFLIESGSECAQGYLCVDACELSAEDATSCRLRKAPQQRLFASREARKGG